LEENTGVITESPSVEEEVVEDVPQEEVGVVDEQTAEEPANEQAVLTELQRVREELNRQRERSEFFERMAFSQQPQQKVQQELEKQYDPEDLTTYGAVEEMVNRRLQGLEANYRQQYLNTLESAARQKYSDYDSVLGTYTAELIKGNPGKGIAPDPGVLNAIMHSSNPAELAYRIGMTHPDFSAGKVAQGVKKVSQKIEKNLNSPGTLSNVSKTAKKDGSDYWDSASEEEFQKERMKRMGLL